MEDNIKFQDVGIVSFDTNADTKIVYGLTDSTSINHVVNSSEIRTGIGNVYVGEVYESKSLEVSVTPTLGNFSTMAVQTKSGDAVTNTSIDVPYVITREAIDDGASGAEIDLTGFTPVDDEVVVVDKNNELIILTHNYEFYERVYKAMDMNRLISLVAYTKKNGNVFIEKNSKIHFNIQNQFKCVSNTKELVSRIPFFRELSNYLGKDENSNLLNSCLHYKNKTKDISIFDIRNYLVENEIISSREITDNTN